MINFLLLPSSAVIPKLFTLHKFCSIKLSYKYRKIKSKGKLKYLILNFKILYFFYEDIIKKIVIFEPHAELHACISHLIPRKDSCIKGEKYFKVTFIFA